ncbi:SLC13 family permease [Aureimonas psammosilenae]|uniref:SLC13 family permease n=1 Tax=Aureimonas psammosilenae TaxID=2495496 RepID=UPI001260B18E|nr:SLC13 family permease [Aureimonas psammosilenae]
MTLQQILAFGVIAAMMVAFIWGRYRYDLIAAGALVVSVAVGIVAPGDAFSGFSDDIVIIVASALVVSAAIARSGVMEYALQRFAPNVTQPRAQLLILVGIVTVLSAGVKNIGALAIMMPIAFQMARRSGVSASMFLMPMSFGALLGGLMTQIGTSPNIVVSRVRGEMTGTPFTMFDFTPVGATLALVGVGFLAFFYWLLPERKREGASLDEAIRIKNYTSEARVTADTVAVASTVSALQELADREAMVTAILDASGGRRIPAPDAVLREGDILLIEGDPDGLDKIIAQGSLGLSERRQREFEKVEESIGTVEAVIGEGSTLVGFSARDIELFDRLGLNLLAVSRRGRRFSERLSDIRFKFGDVVVLQGDLARMPERLAELDCLPLAGRNLRLGNIRRGLIPVLILLAAMAATATGAVPVAFAFFAAAVLMIVTRALPLRELYNHLDAPILVMLAALIPVSESLQKTGATDVVAHGLSQIASVLPAYGAIGLILVAAMAVTPFLNNAATVLVMAPIAASFATDLQFRPDAFLMAVAIGAGSDFLTPIGHQCNTLVMGPGGYRFGDYWRLGLPLSIIVVLISVPMLMLVWPVR